MNLQVFCVERKSRRVLPKARLQRRGTDQHGEAALRRAWGMNAMAWADRAYADLASFARNAAQAGAWDKRCLDTLDHPPVEKTLGGGIAHVITHSMHHRAQLLYMLRRLGVSLLPEGDVLSWEQARR